MEYRANRSSKLDPGVIRIIGATLFAFVLLTLWVPTADAVETHPFTNTTIGPDGAAAAGEFIDLASVATDSSGNVYVLDTTGSGRLYKFDSAGEPLDFSATGTNFIEGTGGFNGNTTLVNQVAIAPPGSAAGTGNDIYVVNSEVVKIYSPEGVAIGQVTLGSKDLCGVAVDGAGNVFVKNDKPAENPIVRKYTPSANPPTNADESGKSTVLIPGACNLAVDSKGQIYLAGTNPTPIGEEADQELWKLQSLTAEVKTLVDPHSSAVAVEPGTDSVYVSHGTEIVQYAENGSLISKFGEDRLFEAPGVSIAGVDGDVYVANRTADRSSGITFSGRIDMFGPLTVLPKAIAGSAGTISKTSAVLNGTVSADGGPPATCSFEYVTQDAYEAQRFEGASTAPCAPAGPFTGSTAEAVSVSLPGLAPGTEYRYRLVGENENGELGSDENGSAPGKVPGFETLPLFNVQTGPATDVTANSATLNGSIDPEGIAVTECFFEYGITTAYGTSVPCEAPGPGEIGAGNAPVPVHASVTGLSGSTEYHYRLVSGTAESGGVKVQGKDVALGTQGLPQILSEAFSGVGQTSATITGSVNPHSSPTTYFVEYVTQEDFEKGEFANAVKVPVAGATIGEGFVGVDVSQVLEGLIPSTPYHFRLSAKNALGSENGLGKTFTTKAASPLFGACPANEAFRVESSAALPDCRAYEQASSPDKNGGSVAGEYPLMFAAEDGSAVTFYSAAGALPPGTSGGAQTFSTYLARRDAAAGAWSSQRLLPPQETGEVAEFLGATPDLRYAVVEAGIPQEKALFLITTESGKVTPIVPYAPASLSRVNQFGLDGISADGSRVFFESTEAIATTPAVPAPAAGHDNLYMWDGSTGDISLVGVLPAAEGGEAPPEGSFGGSFEWYGGDEPASGGTLNRRQGVTEPLAVAGLHALPPSGKQIFFTSAVTGQLYLRQDLGGASPTTVRISAPNAGVIGSSGEFPAAFLEATPNGSRAFFMSRAKLTADAASGANEGERDLYRWDASVATGQALTDIAPGAEVQGLLGVNSAGTAGYFIARGALASKAVVGGENLYRFAEKAAGGFRITLIATLAKGIETTPDRRNVSPKIRFNEDISKSSRVSEDGNTLLFSSTKSLTGYDNVNLEGMSCPGGACPELYLYSAQAGKVTCISCDPTGEMPIGAANLQDNFFNAYLTPVEPPAIFPSRNLSADGARVFFQTPDPLVAADKNGNASCPAFGGQVGKHNLAGPGHCQDVYEWEAVGSGSCTAVEANGGCLYLLSTGQSAEPSYFVGASKDGSSAFIATASQLVPADRDQADDVYDVREGGGLASQHVRPPVPCSSTEACKGPGLGSTPIGSPSTSSFRPGNATPRHCKKGQILKKGKCVKKAKKHHKKKAKKHHRKSKRAAGKKSSGGAK